MDVKAWVYCWESYFKLSQYRLKPEEKKKKNEFHWLCMNVWICLTSFVEIKSVSWYTWPGTRTFAKCQKCRKNRGLQQNSIRVLRASSFACCTFSPPQSGYQSKTPVGPISDSESRLCIDLQGRDSRTNVNLVPKKDSLPRGGGRKKKVTNWVWKW